jgi:hypothetical protein
MVKGSGRNAKEVERIVVDFERSGVSRRLYCEQNGMAVPTLDWYRRRVRASRGSPNLVPVRVESTLSAGNGSASAGFSLVLDNGRRIETGWGFDENQLARLIRIAGAA